jgi:hypothetical protein
VDATRPAAGPLLPFQQLGTGALDATLARRLLFGVINPADEFIAAERCQARPKLNGPQVSLNCCLEVIASLVNSAFRKVVQR